jgi:nucleolar protein 15
MNLNLNEDIGEVTGSIIQLPSTENKLVSSAQNKNSKKRNLLNSKLTSNVVYIGHLPNSLSQTQFLNFFQNFGSITRLKLAKNLKTGKSKHYGFIEFKYSFSISILKKFLKNFKLLGKSLKVRVYSKGEVHSKMFWGSKRVIENGRGLSNYCRRFSKTKLMEGLVNSGKLIEDETIKKRLERRNRRIEKREEKTQEKLNKAGIDYVIPSKKKKNKNKNN